MSENQYSFLHVRKRNIYFIVSTNLFIRELSFYVYVLDILRYILQLLINFILFEVILLHK